MAVKALALVQKVPMPTTTLGGFVRAARLRAGMSGKELADRLGYSLAWVYKVEKGRAQPSLRLLSEMPAALGLSSWETRYLYVLGGRMTPIAGLEDESVQSYLDALLPNPAAWLTSAWTAKEYNAEFGRIFKGIALVPNLIHWHFASVKARDVIVDWTATSEWCVGWLRFGVALDPSDAMLARTVQSLMPMRAFRAQWDAQVIPVDPGTRPWVVRDLDERRELTLDMRAWRNTYRPGVLLLGAVTRSKECR